MRAPKALIFIIVSFSYHLISKINKTNQAFYPSNYAQEARKGVLLIEAEIHETAIFFLFFVCFPVYIAHMFAFPSLLFLFARIQMFAVLI